MRAIFTESLVHETLFNTVVYGSNETHIFMHWKCKIGIYWNFGNKLFGLYLLIHAIKRCCKNHWIFLQGIFFFILPTHMRKRTQTKMRPWSSRTMRHLTGVHLHTQTTVYTNPSACYDSAPSYIAAIAGGHPHSIASVFTIYFNLLTYTCDRLQQTFAHLSRKTFEIHRKTAINEWKMTSVTGQSYNFKAIVEIMQ